MPIEREDIEILEHRFDERYVKHDDCNEIQKGIDNRLSKGDKQFALINLKLSIITWGIAIIASTAIGALVKEIIELITKG